MKYFIQKELKERNKIINPEFNTSKNMEDYAENFVRK